MVSKHMLLYYATPLFVLLFLTSLFICIITQIVHKKVRQFPCDRCGFQFQAKTHLEAHVRTVHDGERPYRCDQCGFSFGLRSNLLTHERAVHYREAKWNCNVCDTAFNRKHDMFRHMKLMHDIDSASHSASNGKKT